MPDLRFPKEKTRPTLRQVAREVGVSICTVSVVLNGSRSGSRISETTRQAVRAAATRLGYRANQAAEPLTACRTRTLAVVPAAAASNILLGPHLQHVLNGVANAAEERGYDLSLITRCDQSRPADLVDTLLGGRMDGVIVIAPRSDSRFVRMMKEEQLPMVVIDGDPDEFDNVFILDNRLAVGTIVRYLYGLGHRKIGHLGGQLDLYAARVRKDAFFSECQALGIQPEVEWIQIGAFGWETSEEAMHRMLQARPMPTAVFCANDESAFGAIQAIRAAGLRVPEDISVVGLDDVPQALYADPPLTTIRQPVDEIARAAASSLIEFIENGHPLRARTFPGELIERKSSTNIYVS